MWGRNWWGGWGKKGELKRQSEEITREDVVIKQRYSQKYIPPSSFQTIIILGNETLIILHTLVIDGGDWVSVCKYNSFFLF